MGRGSSASYKMSPSRMTDNQLDYNITRARASMDRIGDEMVEASYKITEARMTDRNGRDARVERAQSHYYSLQSDYNRQRDRLSALENEKQSRQAPPEPAVKVFVNSYGEATTREITTSTYERAQRRQSIEIENFLNRYTRR